MTNIYQNRINLLQESFRTQKGENDYLFTHINYFGEHIKSLISHLGKERAKSFLLRFGWNNGSQNAIALKKEYPDAPLRFLLEQGMIIHTLEGVHTLKSFNLEVDERSDHFYHDAYLENTYEAKQFLHHFGMSNESVCWTIMGYASGFSSQIMGKRIIFKETICHATGHPHCCFVGKYVETWGKEIEEELLLFDELTVAEELEDAYNRIKEQNKRLDQILEITEEHTQLVLAGNDKSVILNKIGMFLSTAVIFEDKNFLSFEYSSPEEQVNTANKISLKDLTKEIPKLQTYLRRIKQNKRAIHIPSTELNGHPSRIIAPVILGNDLMGYFTIIIPDSENKYQDILVMLAEKTASIIGIDLLKERTALQVEHKLRGELFDDLISQTGDSDTLIKRAQYMGYDISDKCQILIVGLVPEWSKIQTKKELNQLIKQRNELFIKITSFVNTSLKNAYIVERQEGLVILAPVTNHFDPKQLARGIRKLLNTFDIKNPPSIGISAIANHIKEIGIKYKECVDVLNLYNRLGKYDEVFSVEELQSYELLIARSKDEHLQNFAENCLKNLLQYEKDNSIDLLNTLYMYLTNECNLQRTSEAMNLSLTGLKYRLQKIKDIGKLDLNNSDQRFNLEFSLRILRTKGFLKL